MASTGRRDSRTLSRTMVRMFTKLSLRSREAMLITQATTVPNTVAMAAPLIPRAGKPKWPPINR